MDALWAKLSEGGKVMMDLGTYPFSERYGWTEDKYGLSWQVMFVGPGKVKQKITPALMFVGQQCGKAEEAMMLYTSLFSNSKIGDIMRHGKNEDPDKDGTIKYATFTLAGQDFAAMDSAHAHAFSFTEAVSFLVNCKTQEEIDAYWEKLSSVPESEQCGWLKDRFGVSWQIVPTVLSELLGDEDPVKASRVMKAMLNMKKLNIAALEKARDQA